MRECNKKECLCRVMGTGCPVCKECKSPAFMVLDDCDICANCINIPNFNRGDDGEQDTTQEETQKDKSEEKAEEIVIEEKTK